MGDARESDLDSWRELRVFSILALLDRLGSELKERRKEKAGLKRSFL